MRRKIGSGKAAHVVFEDAAIDQAVEGVVRGYHFKGVKPHLFHPWDEALGACFDLRKCYWEEPAALRAQYPGLDPAACGPDALAACRPCFEANMRKAATQRKGWWGGWQRARTSLWLCVARSRDPAHVHEQTAQGGENEEVLSLIHI